MFQLFWTIYFWQILLADGVSNPLWAAAALPDAAVRQSTRDTEVAQLYVALIIYQDVPGFEVTVDNVRGVKIFQGAEQVVED